MPNTREERIANMQRSNSRVQTILTGINNVGSEFNNLFSLLPLFARDMISNAVGLQNVPDGEKTLEDFYDYDYESVMLANMAEYLLNMLKTISTSIYVLQDLLHDLQNDPTADESDIEDIKASIDLMEYLLDYGGKQHGSAVALVKAADNPERYTDAEFDSFIDIINEV